MAVKKFGASCAAIVALAAFTVGGGTAVARTTKPTFSKIASDYIPAKIDGKTTAFDPRSTVQRPDPGPVCFIPRGGIGGGYWAEESELTQDFIGGLYDCPGTDPHSEGTGFVVGLGAVNVVSSVAALSRKVLLTPPNPAEAVKEVDVKVAKGLHVKVFLYRQPIDVPYQDGSGRLTGTFEGAAAEPRSHLQLSATTVEGGDPLPYLTAMLKAGLGKTARAIT